MNYENIKQKIKQDRRLSQMIIRKNLSKSRQDLNYNTFTKLYKLVGKTPSEIIKEAQEEQKPRIQDNQIIYTEINDRKITAYLYKYYFFLKENNYKNETIATEIGLIRTFLREYDIELPRNIIINRSKPLIREGDLPSREDILRAINASPNKRNKAILYFLASTGIRVGDVLNFKINTLMEACNDYLYENTIKELLNIDSNNIIPCFYFKPLKTRRSDNICCTFCTPECFNAMQVYLKQRNVRSLDEPLFTGRYGNPLRKDAVMKLFQKLNDEEFGRQVNGKRFFKAHNLRKWFITTCNQHSGDLLKVRILAGHTLNNIDATYNEINPAVMRRFYTSLVPYLTLNKVEVKTIKSREYLELERKLALQEQENRRLMSDFDKVLDERVDSAVRRVLERYK